MSRSTTASTVVSAVCGPRLTSTILIRYEGFMKWVPARSSGRAVQPAISAMGMPEVLEISGVPGRTAAESSANTFALMSADSVTASMTAVASATSGSATVQVSSPCSRSVGSAPISWAWRSC